MIHAGILALKDNPGHMEEIEENNVPLIDMVVVNFYPFKRVSKEEGKDLEKVLDNIDIGGPTMLRAASKNFKNVAAVSSSDMYKTILEELKNNGGRISYGTLLLLASEAFDLTSKYDTLIAKFLLQKQKIIEKSIFPQNLVYEFDKICDLRYGENPHQRGAFYKDLNTQDTVGIPYTKKLHGKEISFNNILDLDAVLQSVLEFEQPTVSVIKHTSLCGLAIGEDVVTAFNNAYNCDPISSFGSIVGFNRVVNRKVAELISKKFIECIIAPDYEIEALELLKRKKNIRILKFNLPSNIEFCDFDFRKVHAGIIVQEQDRKVLQEEDLRLVTENEPSKEEVESMLFGFRVLKFIKSNAIVITRGKRMVGIGAGQPSRVDAVKIAIEKAGKRAKVACLASDAFFPMPDSIEIAAKAGIKAIIQPGGSIRDKEIIEATNSFSISMMFAEVRHFKH